MSDAGCLNASVSLKGAEFVLTGAHCLRVSLVLWRLAVRGALALQYNLTVGGHRQGGSPLGVTSRVGYLSGSPPGWLQEWEQPPTQGEAKSSWFPSGGSLTAPLQFSPRHVWLSVQLNSPGTPRQTPEHCPSFSLAPPLVVWGARLGPATFSGMQSSLSVGQGMRTAASGISSSVPFFLKQCRAHPTPVTSYTSYFRTKAEVEVFLHLIFIYSCKHFIDGHGPCFVYLFLFNRVE